ncbi:major facilitator superfamily domain-containing protein [Schizothecium vesticola]|uniref:Major facilitator superfamily domain-containing protein n=1 Tax=Schizothecium vesticola TaxID=314040 RepID=A0AA40KCJ0_9PEZI|nr:major facilitator superfamily domain-containing protein [Schizothecium vesticola]
MGSVFLISIDRTIMSTATPYITQELQSTPDIGWYGSAYLLTACAFQPAFGRMFWLFSVKAAFLMAMFVFLLGSLLCGVAYSSMALIMGRAVTGLGSAGVLTGSFVIVAKAVPLRSRPLFMSVVGSMFGLGASVGPLLGGVFTDTVTWRWCFYLNLLIGGAIMLAMGVFFQPWKNNHANRTVEARLKDLDLVGNVLLLGSFIMLFLAIQRTAVGVPWRSQEIVGLLTGSGVVGVLFVGWQGWKGDDALLPPRIMGQRTVAASCGLGFLTYGAIINLTYFLPIWFQAIHGDSTVISGVHMSPYYGVSAGFSLLAGYIVSVTGYVTPLAVIGSAIGTVGLGLLTLLSVETTTAQWVGFEILTSAGFGLSILQCFTAVQTVLSEDDMAIGTTAVIAAQSLGGAVFLKVGNSVFQNMLRQSSKGERLPGVDIRKIIDAGTSVFRNEVAAEQLHDELVVYNGALRMVFVVGVPLGALAAVVSCFIEFRSVNSNGHGG